jgi:CO dehydrogenase maturation factor
MLRLSIDRLSKSYDYVVIDNEAGLEHLSRRTTRDVDLLLTVTDPTMRGIIAAGRAAKLIRELDTRVGDIRLIVNRVPRDGSGELKLAPELEQAIAENGLKLIGLIPEDPTVGEYDAKGLPLVELPPEAPSRQAVEEIIKSLDGLL